MDTEKYILPVIPVKNLVIFPGMLMHYEGHSASSIELAKKALKDNKPLFVVMQRDPDTEVKYLDEMYEYGAIVKVKQVISLPNNQWRVCVFGE